MVCSLPLFFEALSFVAIADTREGDWAAGLRLSNDAAGLGMSIIFWGTILT